MEDYHSQDVKDNMYQIIDKFKNLIQEDKAYRGSDILLMFNRIKNY